MYSPFNKKGMILFTVIVLIVVALYFRGQKSVHHEIMINASPEQTWKVLTNTADYDEWNPVMKLLEGEIREANKVKYQFTLNDGNSSEIPATVKKIIPNKLLNQVGGVPFFLTYNHRYLLEAMGKQTKLIIHEDYVGIWVNFWNPAPVQLAYQNLNNALKKRVESL